MIQSVVLADGIKYLFKILFFQLRRGSATEINIFYIFG